MPRRTVVLVLCCLAFAGPALATPQGYDAAPQGVAPQSMIQPAGRTFGQPLAVRIELTITDQVGGSAPSKKSISMLAADGERASVRSQNTGRATPNSATARAQFSVDAKSTIVDDKIRLDLTLMYDLPEIPAQAGGDPWSTSLQESMGVILDNGKALVISQSADPRTDRKVTVEVKATILK
jgi:hypothetical protein